METQENTETLEYAGFWIRVGATLIDSILILLITTPLILHFYGWEYFSPETSSLIAGPADFLISWVLPAACVIVFWIYRQATPGKILLSMQIVDASTGKAPSIGQLIGRYFAYYISTLPLGLGLFWVGWDRQKQGWHDKLAHTVVIRRKPARQPVQFKNQ